VNALSLLSRLFFCFFLLANWEVSYCNSDEEQAADLDRARELVNDFLAHADSQTLKIFALTSEAESDLYIGQYGDALAKSREAHRLLETQSDLKREAYALTILRVRGAAFLQVARPEEAIKLFDEGEVLVPAIIDEAKRNARNLSVANLHVAQFYREMAVVHILLRETSDALKAIDKALAAAHASEFQGLDEFLALDRLKDEFLSDKNDPEAALKRTREILSAADLLAGGWLMDINNELLDEGLDPAQIEGLSESVDALSSLTRENRIALYSRFARAYAEKNDVASAINEYVKAIKLIEQGRFQVGDHEALPSFFSSYVDVYDQAIAALYTQSQNFGSSPAPNLNQFGGSYAEIALYFSEAAHARQFAELYGPTLLQNFSLKWNIPKSARDHEEELRRQLIRAVDPFTVDTNLREERRRSEEATRNYLEFLISLDEQYSRAAKMIFPRPIGVRQMPQSPKNTFVIQYKVTDSGLYWWVITDRKILDFGRSEVSRMQLRKDAQGVRHNIESHNDDPAPALALSRYLVRAPFEIIEKTAPNKTPCRVIIIPDDVLHGIPWEILGGSKGQLLGESFIISYAPSITVLAQAMFTPTAANSKSALLIGNTQGESPVTIPISGTQEVFPALGGKEFDKVVTALKTTGYSVDRLENGSATPNNLVKRDSTVYSLIHFDTHGFAETLDPLPSLILHASPPESPLGLLSMPDIARLKLKARLVTLSACRTGLGKSKIPLSGEGVEGVARMFMLAGSKSVLVSLWDVNADATTALMEQFYGELAASDIPDTATALFRAKIHLRQAGYKDPKLWAPFILIGDPSS